MPRDLRRITRDDIWPMDRYALQRREKRQAAVALKRDRRLHVGPFATFHFENFDTMWLQVHEMLFIEKGGEAQIDDELGAYNPLIPQGRELVATLMFEIEEPVRRARELARLGGIEDQVVLSVGGQRVVAAPEGDVERTRADGKTSSVHFLRFPFSDAEVAAFRDPATQVTLGFDHPNYGHMAALPATLRAALAADFA